MPAKMTSRRIKTRTLKNADWEEDFFFILYFVKVGLLNGAWGTSFLAVHRCTVRNSIRGYAESWLRRGKRVKKLKG